MVKIICKECLNIYIGGETPPIPAGCTTLFDYNFKTVTDAQLTSDGWLSVNQTYGQTSNGGNGLHFVDYNTDKPAGIEFPISNIKDKKIKFSIEWQIGTHTRWGGGDFRISTINNSGTGVKDQYTTGFNLCTFPFYATTSGGGQYSGMGTGGRWYTDTPGGSSVGINGDQDGTVYMGTYGNTHLGLTIGAGTWKAEGEYDLKNMIYTCSFSTIINGVTSSATFTRTFNNMTNAEKAKIESILNGDYGDLYVILNNGRGYGYNSSYDINFITQAKVEVCGNEGNYYYSDASFNEYQSLVDTIGSINFLDSGSRFRFNYGVYIGDRTALDFDGTTMRTINLDTLTVTSSKSSTINGRVRYFGDNRILTSSGIADFQGNIITSFSYDNVTPGLDGEVRARSGSNIYRGEVSGDNVTFTLIGAITDFYRGGGINYARGGLYYAPSVDYWADSKKGGWTLFDANTYAKTYIPLADSNNYNSMNPSGGAGADGKYYQMGHRNYGGSSESLNISRRGKLHKLGTTDEGLVGSSVSNNSWLAYGDRFGHLIGNFVSGGMNSNNGTGNGYCSNNYFIDTEGNATLVQSNAFAYDSGILGVDGFIDENGWLYPRTYGGGSGVILKPDKAITDLDWKNPYLWR